MNERETTPVDYIVFITGEITQEIADLTCARMLEIDFMNKSEGIQKPISLIINSPGGSITSAFQICDIMDFIESPVYTTGVGLVASSALIIFMNGELGHRIISEKCQILSHRYSWGFEGNHAELIAVQPEIINTHQRILNHYLECTGLSTDILEKEILLPTDRWITHKQAVLYKLADKIYTSPKKLRKALYGKSVKSSKSRSTKKRNAG
jgi:ATP-dependent Clp protease protease subunit